LTISEPRHSSISVDHTAVQYPLIRDSRTPTISLSLGPAAYYVIYSPVRETCPNPHSTHASTTDHHLAYTPTHSPRAAHLPATQSYPSPTKTSPPSLQPYKYIKPHIFSSSAQPRWQPGGSAHTVSAKHYIGSPRTTVPEYLGNHSQSQRRPMLTSSATRRTKPEPLVPSPAIITRDHRAYRL
jgi:hypothetical protein